MGYVGYFVKRLGKRYLDSRKHDSLLFAVPSGLAIRLDRFISKEIADVSRSRIQEWIEGGRVEVDGRQELRGSLRLRGGEVVEVDPAPLKPLRAEAEDLPLDIVYEDSDIAVINKPAGLTVHAGGGASSGTLVNALLYHFDTLSGASGELRPGIVHRLDRLTSGVIVVAKHDRAHQALQQSFERREVGKEYWAIAEGDIAADPNEDKKLLRHGRPVYTDGHWWLRIEKPIRRDQRNRVKMAISPGGRESITDVRRLRGVGTCTLLEVRIHTGRTHQIRVHLSAVGHPVVGDPLYGARKSFPGIGTPARFFLHARRMRFQHPSTGEEQSFEAPLPLEFEQALSALRL